MANVAQMVEALNNVEPCILDSAPWSHILAERYGSSGSNHDYLKDQYDLWPRLVRLPRLIYEVIEYARHNTTNDEMNRALRQRAYKLREGLDLSSFKVSSLQSFQLEFDDPNASPMARAYGVIAATNYVSILAATILLVNRLVFFLDTKSGLFLPDELFRSEESCTEKSSMRKLRLVEGTFSGICTQQACRYDVECIFQGCR